MDGEKGRGNPLHARYLQTQCTYTSRVTTALSANNMNAWDPWQGRCLSLPQLDEWLGKPVRVLTC